MAEERIDWLRGKPLDAINAYLPWRAAVEAADAGDKAPLIDLLRSGSVPGPEARELIADLLERYNLRRPNSRPRTPAYRTTEAEADWNDSIKLYRYHRRKGLGLEEALAEVAKEKRLGLAHRKALRSKIRGGDGGTRRKRGKRASGLK